MSGAGGKRKFAGIRGGKNTSVGKRRKEGGPSQSPSSSSSSSSTSSSSSSSSSPTLPINVSQLAAIVSRMRLKNPAGAIESLTASLKSKIRSIPSPVQPARIRDGTDPRHFHCPASMVRECPSQPPPWTIIKRNVHTFKVARVRPESDECACANHLKHRSGGGGGGTGVGDFPTFCEEDCVNRLLRIECWGPAILNTAGGSNSGSGTSGGSSSSLSADKRPYNCLLGPGCGNRALQEQRQPLLELQPTRGKGWGCFAGADITSGSYVTEYMGEIINEAEQLRRMEEYKKTGEAHYYLMEIDSNQYIDARFKSNLARFINHSCAPNCELQRWNVEGYTRIGIFAIDDIRKGEEITYDYKFFTAEETKCHCGAATCRKLLGANLARERDRGL